MLNTVPDSFIISSVISSDISSVMTQKQQKQTLLHVAVAVIIKADQVLISKRPEHVPQGGLWEFPGGKVETGESIEGALKREIQEELGIQIHESQPLIKITHHYADKSVLLDTHLVTRFKGQSYPENQLSIGAEGQSVQWVAIKQLRQYAFPAANSAIINALQLPSVYAISADLHKPDYKHLQSWLDRHQLVQLRLKSRSGKKLEQFVGDIMEMASGGVQIMFNSSMQLPETLNKQSAGVHLTSRHLFDDGFIKQYKKNYPDKLVSASCHNSEEIERANNLRLDFITVSPVQKTQSHPEQQALGWERFQLLTDQAIMPVYALGGIQPEDTQQAQLYGAQGVAGIRGFV